MKIIGLLFALLVLSALCAAASLLLRTLLRGAAKRRLLANAHGIGCSLSEEFGISVLCSGIDDPEALAELLAPEYSRFEVVAVLDRSAQPGEFAEIVARFRMIRVEWSNSAELPQAQIRSLWRSRRRSCRRLVLVDRPQLLTATPEQHGTFGDWTAAAAVAAYDYLLPVGADITLLPDAIVRLVAELGEHPAGTLQAVRSHVGVPVTLLARDVVVDAGGFGPHPARGIPRRRRIDLWEPLARRTTPHERDERRRSSRKRHPGRLLGLALLACFALTAFAAASGHRTGAACAAAGAVLAAAAIAARQLTARNGHP